MVGGARSGHQRGDGAAARDERRRRLVADDPRIYEQGDVVWSIDRPVLHLRDGTKVPMRLTVIAIVEAEELRVKHCHYSVGAVNEETFGRELTTEERSGRG